MRTKKPPTHYLPTDADGIVPASRAAGTPLNIAEAVGAVVDHPNPCKNRWYDETAFSYFRTTSAPGEALEDVPGTWPVRLWEVEPLGESGNRETNGRRDERWRLYAHQLRIVREVPAHLVLGPRGQQVIDLVDHELPGLVERWAADYAADPKGTSENYQLWRLCPSRQPEAAAGDRAFGEALSRARSLRRSAALWQAGHLAMRTARRVEETHGRSAGHYAAKRAEALAVAVLLEDKLRTYCLTSLRGTTLDEHQPATATR